MENSILNLFSLGQSRLNNNYYTLFKQEYADILNNFQEQMLSQVKKTKEDDILKEFSLKLENLFDKYNT